jgi:hypothetical protein
MGMPCVKKDLDSIISGVDFFLMCVVLQVLLTYQVIIYALFFSRLVLWVTRQSTALGGAGVQGV